MQTMLAKPLSQSTRKVTAAAIVLTAFVLTVYAVYIIFPVHAPYVPDTAPVFGQDWKGAFYETARLMLAGQNPYGHGAYNPPWIFLPLIPIAFCRLRSVRR